MLLTNNDLQTNLVMLTEHKNTDFFLWQVTFVSFLMV